MCFFIIVLFRQWKHSIQRGVLIKCGMMQDLVRLYGCRTIIGLSDTTIALHNFGAGLVRIAQMTQTINSHIALPGAASMHHSRHY